jgi:ubiquinone biosynthesis accessory factor UbiJ
LTVVLVDESPLAMAQVWMQGGKPKVRVEGDVQLAAELNWLADHVRWDLEEDMARVVGDAPAHWMSQAAGTMAQALQQWTGKGAAAAVTTPHGTVV